MKMTSKKYLQYLAGLAVAATASPALAGPPPRPRNVEDKVQVAGDLADKVAATSANAWWPYWQLPYIQSFGEVWVEYGPFLEIQPPRATDGITAALTPSEAFAKIRNS